MAYQQHHAKRRLGSAPAKAAQGLVFLRFGDIFLITPCKFFNVTFKTMNISFGIFPLVLIMSDVFESLVLGWEPCTQITN